MNNNELKSKSEKILNDLLNGKYKDYTGWMIVEENNEALNEINSIADNIRKQSEVLVVVGVGGSYLGAKAIIEALTNKYKKKIELMYLGNSLSTLDLHESLEYLKGKDFTVNLISKSGRTLEPSLAFRFLKDLLKDKYGEKGNDRIVVTTGEGEMLKYAENENLQVLRIPEDVGGRYSVFTPVGLLPIATAGLDVRSLVSAVREASAELLTKDSIAVRHAQDRVELYEQGKDIEVLAYYEPRLKYLAEWWKQLYGESEGKDGKGIFPASACFTTDLHSLGQLIQEGKRNMFETHLFVNSNFDLYIRKSEENFDRLNYLSGLKMSMINEKAKEGTIEAHLEGGVPVLEIPFKGELNEKSLGYIMYFFMLSCAISSCLIDVHPFTQPGVESYKNNVSKLLQNATE